MVLIHAQKDGDDPYLCIIYFTHL